MIDTREMAEASARTSPIPEGLELVDAWADEMGGTMMINAFHREHNLLYLGLADGQGNGLEIVVEPEAAIRLMKVLDRFVNDELDEIPLPSNNRET